MITFVNDLDVLLIRRPFGQGNYMDKFFLSLRKPPEGFRTDVYKTRYISMVAAKLVQKPTVSKAISAEITHILKAKKRYPSNTAMSSRFVYNLANLKARSHASDLNM